MRLLMIFAVLIPVAAAQHAGGFGGAGHGFGGLGRGAPGFGRGFGTGRGGLYNGSYWPLLDPGFWDDYQYWYPEEQPPPRTVVFVPPHPPPPPPRPITPAIREYTAPPESEVTPAAAFTVALKDGTQLSAIAAWIQDGQLHIFDSQGKQRVLSAEVIDREATNRSNAEKHLQLQLPPDA